MNTGFKQVRKKERKEGRKEGRNYLQGKSVIQNISYKRIISPTEWGVICKNTELF
jgi:hypothetical protein